MKANLLAAAALAIGALGAASCAGPRVIPTTDTPRPSAPSPRPVSAPSAAPPAATWIDNPATAGDWQWSTESGQSVARFAGGRLVLHCDRTAQVVRLARSERGAPGSGSVSMRILTSAMARQLTASPQAGAYVAEIAARDRLLDAMAFSKGRFAVETAGLPTLYVPSWTEVSRVIEDCR